MVFCLVVVGDECLVTFRYIQCGESVACERRAHILQPTEIIDCYTIYAKTVTNDVARAFIGDVNMLGGHTHILSTAFITFHFSSPVASNWYQNKPATIPLVLFITGESADRTWAPKRNNECLFAQNYQQQLYLLTELIKF